jgi:hypothetical protein
MEPPDAQEKRIRFGCGFVFGTVTAALGSGGVFLLKGRLLLAFCLVCGVLLGLLAMRYGDRFWEKIGAWWPL